MLEDDWAASFFDQASVWWKRPAVDQRDHRRVAALREVVGPAPLSVLEIGCGNGETAVAMARAGYAVVGVDVSEVRIAQAQALDRAVPLEGPQAARPDLRCADMYTLQLYRTFDAVVYWNGFGVGSDLHQRTMLRRIEQEWLGANGFLLMDVYSPWRWAAEHGRRSFEFGMVREVRFDPFEVRFEERWWRDQAPERVLTQSGRCYAVSDFTQLLSDTGLNLVTVRMSPDEIDGEVGTAGFSVEHWFQVWSWLAVVQHSDGSCSGQLRGSGAETRQIGPKL